IGYDLDGKPVRARDLKACGAMMVLLNEAIMPNLVQTTEHTPAIIHGGPFANIAHGTNSVIADKIALKLADYVVVETGFGSDLGAEKFFDIVSQIHRLKPDAAVIVVSAKAIRYHGGIKSKDDFTVEKFKKGLENLEFHVKNVRKFGVPAVVSINKFETDLEVEIDLIKEKCAELGVECSVTEFFTKGGEGGIELAEKIVKITETTPSDFKPLYRLSVPLIEKIKLIATEIYGADDVYIERKAMRKLEKYIEHGYDHLPVCIAKTPNSISDNPKLVGVPKGWTLTVTDARLFAGAGFVVAICGDIMLMPGLSKNPAAFNMDVDEYGNIIGLF
ncbi:Formate--tetrahydrofolate ligase, partial [Candidatus Kryptonium thompsonii]